MRICVFCKKYPVSKSSEHVIPRWLMELTGDPKRKIRVASVDQTSRFLYIDSFKFPACLKCNSEYSLLENRTKLVVKNLIEGNAASANDIETLMDWLDKVRVGLWLGSLMYSGNPYKVTPKFAISSRPKKDRIVYLARTKSSSSIRIHGLNIIGFNDPLFHVIPCLLGLRVNGLMIFSLSADAILYGKIALPNYKILAVSLDGAYFAQEVYSNEIIGEVPYIGRRYTTFIQVNYLRSLNKDLIAPHLVPYLSEDFKSSRVLMRKGKKFIIYPKAKLKMWQPEAFENFGILFQDAGNKFWRLRHWLIQETPFPKELIRLKRVLLKSKPISFSNS